MSRCGSNLTWLLSKPLLWAGMSDARASIRERTHLCRFKEFSEGHPWLNLHSAS